MRTRRRWTAEAGLLLAAALVAVVAVGCARDDPEERRFALAELVATLALLPRPGENAIGTSRTQSKSDRPYFTADGVLELDTREAALERVEAALAREGWTVFESGDVDGFLGACARGRRGSMVARVLVGWVESSGFNPYPRIPGKVYVAASVGHARSNQAWTDVDRPSCGAG